MPVCVKCGNAISEKSIYSYCLRCGHPIGASLDAPPATVVQAGGQPCEKCGNWISDKSQYANCLKCGHPIGAPLDYTPPPPTSPQASPTASAALQAAEFSSDAAYNDWLKRRGSVIEVVNVAARKQGGYMVTFKGPPEAAPPKRAPLQGIVAATVIVLGFLWLLSSSGAKQPTATAGAVPAAVAAATARAATGTPPSPSAATGTPPSPAPRIGDVVESGNWRYSVRQVDTASEIDVSTSRLFKSVLKPKGLYVVVLIQLTNIGNRNFSINSHDFELRDSKGIKYDMSTDTFQLVSYRSQTQLGEQMPPGVLLTTTLLFDVAPGTTGMQLWLEQAKRSIRLE